ncbi:MAG: hypothetical protein ABI870_10740, partial [Rhodanobacter sp.]
MLLLAACSVFLFAACAHGSSLHGARNAPQAQAAGQLSIQVNDDRLTLAAAGVPQVYLYGVIDADAPRRVEALIRSWKIPRGSDVYLNAAGGDVNAGLALGRLFRAGSIVTHLGTPRRTLRTRSIAKDALCADACAYAYFGGLYRWAPTGKDRIGVHRLSAMDAKPTGNDSTAPGPVAIAAYLKDMGIQASALAQSPVTPREQIAWLDADQMMATGLANNGRLPLTSTYQMSSGMPALTLNQIVRNGVNRVTIICRPDGLTLTSYYIVGSDRARKVVGHAARSFFEV